MAKTSSSVGSTTATDPWRADQVARGIGRLLARNGIWCAAEVSLANGRRADLMGIDSKGHIIIVEIKVSRGDLISDAKWPDYLEYCDRYFWGVPPDFDRTPLLRETSRPDSCGVIVADKYDGEILRHAALEPLATGRRKALTTRLARLALRRHAIAMDPLCAEYSS